MPWKRLVEGFAWVLGILLLPELPGWIANCHAAWCTTYGPAIIRAGMMALGYLRQHEPVWDGVDRRQQP